MLSARLAALVLAGAYIAAPPSTLLVLRSSPDGQAGPTAQITVTFDRPVAGSLDRSVDPGTILRVNPSVEGKLEWRDPVTIRLRPANPLKPGSTYTVTVANNFAAMDGSRLAAPYQFTFTVTGPRLLTGNPVSEGDHPAYLGASQKFELVYSAPLELSSAAAVAYLEFSNACSAPGTVRLKPVSQRAITDKDPWQFRDAGGYDRAHDADPLRRVVQFVPEKSLPLGCTGEVVALSTVDAERTSPFLRWGFQTYGAFSMVRAACSSDHYCPAGGVRLEFSTPVRGTEVLRAARILPSASYTISDSTEESSSWYLETELKANTAYAVVLDPSIKDIFGQHLEGNPAGGFRTSGYAPLVEHAYGRMTVERNAYRTLAVKYVNVDTLDVMIAPVPDALLPKLLQWNRWSGDDDTTIAKIVAGGTHQRVAVIGEKDRVKIYGVRLPLYNAQRPGSPLLQLVQVTSPQFDSVTRASQPHAIVQVTDLGVHARIGVAEGAVWVTAASTGQSRPGAMVTLYNNKGVARASARTNADGVAYLSGFRPDTSSEESSSEFEGYVVATLGNDRALTTISQYDPDLSPWQFNVRSAWGEERLPAAGAVFTERGIYRPGEAVYAKAILRDGNLGALKAPPVGTRVRWLFSDRESGTLRDTTVVLSTFGTAAQTITLPAGLALGTYEVKVQRQFQGRWVDLAHTSYRVAEYRPPEFLVDAVADTAGRMPGDTLKVAVEARYLFGAPMGRASLEWTARQTSLYFWDLDIPGTDGYFLGENGWWWEDDGSHGPATDVIASGTDTLDAAGHSTLRVGLQAPPKGRPARATVEATVTDVNRQTVSTSASVIVHPAAFYLAAKPLGTSYFWIGGTPQSVAVLAVRPDGSHVPGVKIQGRIIRREWHQVHRDREGYGETVGEWVSDTVAGCALTSGTQPVNCAFTPASGGQYIVGFSATDPAGHPVSTSFYRWATGKGWVPWSDESQFKMDVIPDRTRYSVGDTATILFASPFTDAEAWVTVEREGVIEQRRLRLTSGSTTLKFPVTEAYAPNAFVSIVVARGRSAPPGPLDDPGRPTIRVGYAELKVTSEIKRMTVAVEPQAKEYRPGDTARVRLRVKDAAGKGQRSEVTLWAVDEGVLSLTGYRTPDPIDLLYQARGLGLRLSSNLTTVAPQVPEGEKGRAPGGGGGIGESDILRSRFKTTAFFLGSIVTDTAGNALAKAKLPDNLTTFRVMAVAVTQADRYGNGQSPLLVTRPLVARPALPRFVREGDQFTAGVVVNQRAGGTPTVQVQAEAANAQLSGAASRSATLEAGRGREVRFDFQQPAGSRSLNDSATFRFKVTGGADQDAVQNRLAIQPAYRPRAYTLTGIVEDTATAEFLLPSDIDPARSRLELSLGASPLSVIRGLGYELKVYPYYCTEQVSSAAQPIIALYRAQQAIPGKPLLKGNPRHEIETAVAMISRRQRPDGGIGYWNAGDWTTPWLSAYAGITLIEARSVGVAVDDSVLARLGRYLTGSLHDPQPIRAPVVAWYEEHSTTLGDQVAAADFLSRFRHPDLAAENELLRSAAQLTWEDRVRLAEVLARRGAVKAARGLIAPIWKGVRIEGRRAVVPDSAQPRYHYFYSRVRPVSRLLTATMAVDSGNALIGPLIETLVQEGRAGLIESWNTQDYASMVTALAAFERRRAAAATRGFAVLSKGQTILASGAGAPKGGTGADSSVALTGLLSSRDGKQALTLSLAAAGAGPGVFYYLTVREVPLQRPLNPDDAGIQVERWYERYDSTAPIIKAVEGELVRVRLRITVPSDRQFVVLDDALPAGLEAIDLSLRTAGGLPGPGTDERAHDYLAVSHDDGDEGDSQARDSDWYYGSWDSGWWSPFDHQEIRDDRVVYFATVLWKGTYTASYIARATTPGIFVRPPAHAEEMYNPAVHGRSDGGLFTVTPK
ncbi:MAG: Ig-like domain-containing protein [Gemmatimonadota bacterium]